MAADEAFRSALLALADALAEIPAPSMIIGGVAVIAAGVPRQTIDIDATILGRVVEVEPVAQVLARHGIVPRISDGIRFARERHVLLLEHSQSAVTMEITFAWLPFEEEALARAVAVDLGGVTVRVATPEDLVIYKAAAWRDRDRSDIERLLVLHGTSIDLQRVRSLVGEIAAALGDDDRMAEFDELVERAHERGRS